MDPALLKRVVAVCLLVGLLLGLGVWYGSLPPAPEVGAHPDEADLAEEYSAYVGQPVTVSGVITETSPVTIAVDSGPGETIELRITNVEGSVRRGDVLRVFGVAEADRTIRAENAFTVTHRGLWYAWIASFAAGVWVLARIVRHWRLNRGVWALEPREWPLYETVRHRVRTVGRREGK